MSVGGGHGRGARWHWGAHRGVLTALEEADGAGPQHCPNAATRRALDCMQPAQLRWTDPSHTLQAPASPPAPPLSAALAAASQQAGSWAPRVCRAARPPPGWAGQGNLLPPARWWYAAAQSPGPTRSAAAARWLMPPQTPCQCRRRRQAAQQQDGAAPLVRRPQRLNQQRQLVRLPRCPAAAPRQPWHRRQAATPCCCSAGQSWQQSAPRPAHCPAHARCQQRRSARLANLAGSRTPDGHVERQCRQLRQLHLRLPAAMPIAGCLRPLYPAVRIAASCWEARRREQRGQALPTACSTAAPCCPPLSSARPLAAPLPAWPAPPGHCHCAAVQTPLPLLPLLALLLRQLRQLPVRRCWAGSAPRRPGPCWRGRRCGCPLPRPLLVPVQTPGRAARWQRPARGAAPGHAASGLRTGACAPGHNAGQQCAHHPRLLPCRACQRSMHASNSRQRSLPRRQQRPSHAHLLGLLCCSLSSRCSQPVLGKLPRKGLLHRLPRRCCPSDGAFTPAIERYTGRPGRICCRRRHCSPCALLGDCCQRVHAANCR